MSQELRAAIIAATRALRTHGKYTGAGHWRQDVTTWRIFMDRLEDVVTVLRREIPDYTQRDRFYCERVSCIIFAKPQWKVKHA